MAQQDKRGPDTVNVGREAATEGGTLGSAEQRIRREDRSPDEMKYEVAQRGSATDAHGERSEQAKGARAPASSETSGYANRADREDPGKGLQQSGERQSHELPGEGTRVGDGETKKTRANSQSGAAIRDFEDRPSR